MKRLTIETLYLQAAESSVYGSVYGFYFYFSQGPPG